MLNKVRNLRELKIIVNRLKKQHKTIVFTNGCFDLIHPGHVSYLEKARQKGDVLILGLNSDSSVKKIKGKKRPILNQKARAMVLSALTCIDYIVIFNETTPINLIRALKSDIIIKGADWKNKGIVGTDLVRAYGGKVSTIKLVKGYSTSNLIKKIVQRF